MRMNCEKLNTVIIKWNYMEKGQMKFSRHQMMQTVKSLYPLCSHNICEYKHNFLNAATVNDQFKRIESEILRPHSKLKRG